MSEQANQKPKGFCAGTFREYSVSGNFLHGHTSPHSFLLRLGSWLSSQHAYNFDRASTLIPCGSHCAPLAGL